MTHASALRALLCLTLLTGCPAQVTFSLSEDAFWSSAPPELGTGPLLLSTNSLDDTVSLIDLGLAERGQLIERARLPVGLNPVDREGPHHVAASPDGTHYYVGISNYVPGGGSGPHGAHGTGTVNGSLLKLRASDGVRVGAVQVDRNPGDVRLTPDGLTAVVSHYDLARLTEALLNGAPSAEMDARLVLVDTATMTRKAEVPLCPASHGIAFSPDGRTAYVSCYTDELAIVDLASDAHPVRRVRVLGAGTGPVTSPACEPYAVHVSPSGESVFVSCLKGQVLRYDPATGAMDPTRSTRLQGPALFGAFSPDGRHLVIPFQGRDQLAVLDATTAQPVSELPLPRPQCVNPHAVRFTRDGARLLVVCEGDHVGLGGLVLLRWPDGTVEASLPLGRFPDALEPLWRAP